MNGFLGAVGSKMCERVESTVGEREQSQPLQIHAIANNGILMCDSHLVRRDSQTSNSVVIDGQILISETASQNHAGDVLELIESGGLDAIRDVDGFYSLAYFNQRNQALSLLRDQWGAHAIYYIADERGIAFSTSILHLIPLLEGRVLANLNAAGEFLLGGRSAPEGETFFKGIYQVPSRSIFTITTNVNPTFEICEFHTPIRLSESDRNISYDDAVVQARALFKESIAHCLSGTVRPGFTLSGGVDSSAVVIIASNQSPNNPISTYSYVTNARKSIDEERYMDVANEAAGSNPNKLRMEAHDYFEQLPIATKELGSPLAGASQLAQFLLYQMASRDDIDVMINGVEADSAFSGHNYFLVDRLQELLVRGSLIEASRLIFGIILSRNRTTYKAVMLETVKRLPTLLSRPLFAVIQPTNSHDWLGFEFCSYQLGDLRRSDAPGGQRGLQNHLRAGLASDRLLRYAELCGAAFSIYSRTPFLFRRMNEFIFSLPSEYLISEKGETKKFLRSVVEGIVPEVILDRRDKIGFEAPTKDWFLAEPDKVQEYLDLAVELGIIAPDHGLLNKPNMNTLSRVISYTEWAKSFSVRMRY